ncbi:hypothetical protein J8273_0206 [Carpediemonas membranifera]|uniref:Uncharacterized protein n=1 Tax=Carpediemonas membranifera TaxID=201153 RepID=A0A8J6B3L4_9EUKA|nr:hypothetical protein J8273_0206 [Carpediemonas membranifera]|eukprot:KAG9394998.1 hypothetical protein J8273_0206 [Carpediemonas membranifera]
MVTRRRTRLVWRESVFAEDVRALLTEVHSTYAKFVDISLIDRLWCDTDTVFNTLCSETAVVELMRDVQNKHIVRFTVKALKVPRRSCRHD